jgi:UDP-N-acetylglucosamine 4,6-dehydratase
MITAMEIRKQQFSRGFRGWKEDEDYNSHNTERLNIEEIKNKLLKLDYIQEELKNWRKNK